VPDKMITLMLIANSGEGMEIYNGISYESKKLVPLHDGRCIVQVSLTERLAVLDEAVTRFVDWPQIQNVLINSRQRLLEGLPEETGL